MIDLEVLRAYLGDEALIHRFLRAFREDAPLGLERLRLACQQADTELWGREAHSLKSQLRYLGANHASDLAAILEERASNPTADPPTANDLFNEFEEALTSVFMAIDDIVI
jgi:HPt (histidine-containing phosphotransfer) domain-containing protein